MKKKYQLKAPPRAEGFGVSKTTEELKEPKTPAEKYLAPPPPKDGRVVGVDCHPDTFTAALFEGQTPHDARKLGSRENMSMEAMLKWAARELTAADLILMEAGANSFELCRRLGALGLRTCVLESAHVGKHAKTYVDNDKMAAARIVMVYLAGNAPCVWIPDEASRQRRELLHAYRKTVRDHTAATNSLKSFLNGHGIRLGKRSLARPETIEWIYAKKPWTPLQKRLLDEYFANRAESKARRQRLERLIALEMSDQPEMMRCMKLLGIGRISAFALWAIIGDIQRFPDPKKLVAYIGLNPGRRQSGKGKNIHVGIGHRGRGDLRNLLIQGAQAVLRQGRHTALGQWGWKLFARKGNRNVAVAAIARKLVVQVWHLLQGHPATMLEGQKSFLVKIQRLAVTLGAALRKEIGLGDTLDQAIQILLRRCKDPTSSPA
jgi:transposase